MFTGTFFAFSIYGLVMYKADSASYFWYSIMCDNYIVSFTCYVGFLTVLWDSEIALLVFLYSYNKPETIEYQSRRFS